MKKDPNPFEIRSPEKKRLIDEIVHGTFVCEGMMVAFPTCFPGVTLPIAPGESHITALDITQDGIVYGGTSGRKIHLFVGMFHGVTGAIFDMGSLDGKQECPAVCCGINKLVMCANGADDGLLVAQDLQPLPFDLIQEWSFSRKPFTHIGTIGDAERILHAVMDRSRQTMIGISEGHLFTVDLESMRITILAQLHGVGQIAVGPGGCVYGMDEEETLWRFDPATEHLDRSAINLPEGDWRDDSLRWAEDPTNEILYTVDTAGRLFSLDRRSQFSRSLGQVPISPIGPMAVTLDGRLFGMCGEGIGRLFCYHPHRGKVTDLGVAVSVIERRRYGYVFGDAVVGRDGEIIFGEDDNLGHLWLYFPKIEGD